MDSSQLGEIFFNDNYSIEDLLNRTRQHGLALGELRQMLVQYQQDLNQNSLELFNNNYDRFYKLSYIISCLNEPIKHLTEPIVAFRERLGEVCENHDQYLKQINQRLSSLEDTSKNKLFCKRLVELTKRRDRIEEQVNCIDWSVRATDQTSLAGQSLAAARDNDIEFQSKCDHLERVSVELYHLINEVQPIRPTNDELISMKRALEVSIEERQLQIDKWFEGAFLEAVELQDSTLIGLVVRTYQQKDALSRIDAVWRKRIVKPYINLTVTDSQLTGQITQTYNLLLEFLKRNTELIESNFIVKSFWQEVVEALGKLDKVYSLNNLDTFKLHYEETRRFLNQQDQYANVSGQSCSSFCTITTDLVAHHKSKILAKFNLKGYFNHRLSQIASSVESSLTSNPLSEIPADSSATTNPLSCFKIKICMHIYVHISRCWSEELYIDTLELQFVQLACRILNRFADWLGKLRLSDFRITGSSSLDKQTNFLAQQDAIMRLLLDDCNQLDKQIRQYFIESSPTSAAGDAGCTKQTADPNLASIKSALILESLKAVSTGLSNVQSLQRLIER